MWSKIHGTVLAFAAIAALGGPAMSAPIPAGTCRVLHGEKLPRDAGSADALCSAVQRAIAARAPHVRYSAEVRVMSKSVLSATLVANGRTLPEQQFAVSDRNLNPRSIERFAAALAEEVAKAAKVG
jgi:hypothetical protein